MPVLEVFAVRDPSTQRPYEGFYTIGCAQGSISIPSQISRAQMLAERLLESNRVCHHDHVCIIGAGFAGVTAALYLAERGVKVHVLERSDEPFSLQLRSQRMIHPHEYDWPLPWFDDGKYDSRYISIPRPMAAQQLAIAAHGQLGALLKSSGSTLHLRYGVEAEVPMADGPHHVGCIPSVPDLPEDGFKVVIRTNTMRERTSITSTADLRDADLQGTKFHSLPYWDNDTILRRVQALGSAGRMVISGAGDGALQDFIYYATDGLSPLEILRRVDPDRTLSAHESDILRWSMQRSRSYPWRSGVAMGCRILSTYHQRMLKVVKDWMTGKIRQSLRELVQRDRPALEMLVRCSHFTDAFPLNVFVALALADAARGMTPALNIRYDVGIKRVEACDRCPNSSVGCGEAHRFDTEVSRCGVPSSGRSEEDSALVVLRHGIEWDPSPAHYLASIHPLPLWFE